jgi:hypothetical protein
MGRPRFRWWLRAVGGGFAALVGVVLFLAAQRWLAIGALQEAMDGDSVMFLEPVHRAAQMPEFVEKALSWVLERRLAPSAGAERQRVIENQNGRYLSRLEGMFFEPVRGMEIRRDDGFHEGLGKALARFPHLRELLIRTDADPTRTGLPKPGAVRELMSALPRLKELTNLHLKGGWLGDAELAELRAMPQLEFLRLDDCQVSSASFATFEALPKLKSLELNGTRITQGDATRLKNLLPNVDVIHR